MSQTHAIFAVNTALWISKQKRDLKLEDYKQLAADSESLMWLDIGGGEPFLRKDLADIICAFDSKIVHIPTNGSLIPQNAEEPQVSERADGS